MQKICCEGENPREVGDCDGWNPAKSSEYSNHQETKAEAPLKHHDCL